MGDVVFDAYDAVVTYAVVTYAVVTYAVVDDVGVARLSIAIC